MFYASWPESTSKISRARVARDFPVSRDCRGFTIIETLVVVAVLAMVSATVILYGKRSSRYTALYVEKQKTAELILRAKSLAISTYTNPVNTCGFGFMADYTRKTYSVFSYRLDPLNPDCDQIKSTRINPDRVVKVNSSSSDVPLNSNLIFQTPPPADAIAYLLFVPPDPVTIMSADPVNGTIFSGPGKLYLQTLDLADSATVTVSPVGQVDF